MMRALPESAKALKALASSLLRQLSDRSNELERQSALIEQKSIEIAHHKALLAAREAQLKEQAAYIEKLKFQLARLQRWRFGKTAEGLSAEQLALWEAELDADIAVLESRLDAIAPEKPAPEEKRQAKRRPLPEALPRVEERHDLPSHDCPECGQALEQIGEEVSEQLDIIPAKFFVRRHVRPKYCCRHCERVHTAALPPQPIDKGLPAPGLIAHVVTAKYLDHLPLYRQEAQFARMGVALSRSTMAGWFGELEVLLEPAVERLIEHLTAEGVLHADETPVPVLDPGAGKTATGYLWAYRSGPWSRLQAVAFDFAMSRAREAPNRFLAPFRGTLLVDGYAGYGELLKRPGMIEAGCWAHARRHFFEVWEATRSPAAQNALVEIGKLYAIECEVKDLSIEDRAAERRRRAAPILAAFKEWLATTYAQSPPRGALARAIGYTLNRWKPLLRYLDDGRVAIDNNPVENTIRGIALGRKNYLFCGSEGGGHRAALFYSLIETAKLNGVDPHAYLVNLLTKLPTAKAQDLDALMPWNYHPQPTPGIIV
jgi:transposase